MCVRVRVRVRVCVCATCMRVGEMVPMGKVAKKEVDIARYRQKVERLNQMKETPSKETVPLLFHIRPTEDK